MAIATKKLRILCLHGYRTNVKVMQDQTRALRRVMVPHADFVFATTPFEARGAPDEVIERLYQDHAPFYEWGHITKLNRQLDNSDNGWNHQYVGFNRVVVHIDKQIQDHGPFDVRDVGLRPLFEHPDGSTKLVPIPSIHLIGKKDQYYDTCREHTELYADNKFVFEHEGGHRFPSGDKHPELYDKISDMIREHCSN